MIYVYESCCNSQVERVCQLSEYLADPSFRCPRCGKELKQVITPVRVMAKSSFEPFVSPVDGSVIASRYDLAEHNKRNNVVNLHDGYDEKAVMDFTKRKWNDTPEQERRKDLNKDMESAIQKLEEGYKPNPETYTEEIPNG